MTVGIAARVQDRRRAARIDAGEGVCLGRGADGVDGDLDVPVGPVLEPDRHRQTRAELAVDLALGRAGSDCGPGNQVSGVLRNNRVEEFRRGRQAHRRQFQQ